MSFVRFESAKQRFKIDTTQVNPTSLFSTIWLVEAMLQTRPHARGRMLDIGCASKPYAPLYHLSAHYGVDWPSTLHQQSKIDAYADAAVLPFADCTFDTVLCTEVLEHLRNPADALGEMARVVKPDGCLLLSVPFLFRIHEEPHDYFRYTPFALAHLLDDAGFERIQLIRRGGTLSVWCDITLRGIGTTFNRILKALRLPRGVQRILQSLVIIPPQRLAAFLLLSLHHYAPAAAHQLDPVDHYTLGYVIIARKIDVRNRG